MEIRLFQYIGGKERKTKQNKKKQQQKKQKNLIHFLLQILWAL